MEHVHTAMAANNKPTNQQAKQKQQKKPHSNNKLQCQKRDESSIKWRWHAWITLTASPECRKNRTWIPFVCFWRRAVTEASDVSVFIVAELLQTRLMTQTQAWIDDSKKKSGFYDWRTRTDFMTQKQEPISWLKTRMSSMTQKQERISWFKNKNGFHDSKNKNGFHDSKNKNDLHDSKTRKAFMTQKLDGI